MTNTFKQIKKVQVKTPGSAPDVDTDFPKDGREDVIDYCIEKYGKDNVSSIVTFNTFKAKNSLKSLCTIYGIPFAAANNLTKLIPPPVEGDDITLEEIFDEHSPRYDEGEDFRRMTEDPQWKKIVEMAFPLDGRIRGTGVHACGLIISNDKLRNTIPTQVRQSDETLVTQWTYPQCENMGLIKMDFLGLETLDIIKNTLENIKNANKEVPDMTELIRGEMNDKKTFELLQKGNTVGIFQLGGQGVRDLLIRAKPTEFTDIAAITALYRPGPMKMNAHNQYADRKNGREDVTYILPEFEGSAVEEVLKDTYGLIVYQEQCMQIATKFAGMTPYESDKLRKAIGKKKMAMMMSLRPKFIQGIVEKGYSEDSANKLWQTIEVFGQYGFNKSHSISYAINAYKTCFLKANYPAEFMAALLQQNTGEPKKISEFLQEVTNMNLNIGPVDINKSFGKISAIQGNKDHDIIYGFSGVKQVNTVVADEIVKERIANGNFTSVSDFLKRMIKNDIPIQAQALGKLADAGAFDCFNVSRLAIKENASDLLKAAKNPVNQTMNIFDLIGGEQGDILSSFDLNEPTYSYNELIKNEADAIGLFVSGHPATNVGVVSNKFNPTTLRELKTNQGMGTRNILGTFTLLNEKVGRNGNRSIAVRIDDGEDIFDCFLPKPIVKRIEKGREKKRIKKARLEGKNPIVGEKSKNPDDMIELYYNDKVKAIESLEIAELYKFEITQKRQGPVFRLMVTDIENLETDKDGALPYEIKFPNDVSRADIDNLLQKHPGITSVKMYLNDELGDFLPDKVAITRKFIIELEQLIGSENIITKEI